MSIHHLSFSPLAPRTEQEKGQGHPPDSTSLIQRNATHNVVWMGFASWEQLKAAVSHDDPKPDVLLIGHDAFSHVSELTPTLRPVTRQRIVAWTVVDSSELSAVARLFCSVDLHDEGRPPDETERDIEVSARKGLLNALAYLELELPPKIYSAIEGLFIESPAPLSPKRLAGRCPVSRRTFDRWIKRVGISSTRKLFAAVRIAWAYDLAKITIGSNASVARTVGYASARSLDSQCIAVSQMRLNELCQSLSSSELAERLLSSLHTPMNPLVNTIRIPSPRSLRPDR